MGQKDLEDVLSRWLQLLFEAQMFLWYNTVLLSLICPNFLPFKKEILVYFMVGGGFLPFVWHRSGGEKAFVGEKFIRWLESQFWDKKSFIASEFFLRKLKYGSQPWHKYQHILCSLSPNRCKTRQKEGSPEYQTSLVETVRNFRNCWTFSIFSRNYTVAEIVSSENKCVRY